MPTRGYELPVIRPMAPNSTSRPFYIYPRNEEAPGCKATEETEYDTLFFILSIIYMFLGLLYAFFGKFLYNRKPYIAPWMDTNIEMRIIHTYIYITYSGNFEDAAALYLYCDNAATTSYTSKFPEHFALLFTNCCTSKYFIVWTWLIQTDVQVECCRSAKTRLHGILF